MRVGIHRPIHTLPVIVGHVVPSGAVGVGVGGRIRRSQHQHGEDAPSRGRGFEDDAVHRLPHSTDLHLQIIHRGLDPRLLIIEDLRRSLQSAESLAQRLLTPLIRADSDSLRSLMEVETVNSSKICFICGSMAELNCLRKRV